MVESGDRGGKGVCNNIQVGSCGELHEFWVVNSQGVFEQLGAMVFCIVLNNGKGARGFVGWKPK